MSRAALFTVRRKRLTEGGCLVCMPLSYGIAPREINPGMEKEPEKWRAGLQAPLKSGNSWGMTQAYAITKAEINEKPLLEYEGPVTLVADDRDLPAALEALNREILLGFDTETRPAFRKGESYLPSLLQLAGETQVWLFQIQRIRSLQPLFEVLARRDILKCGVAIARDVKELQDLHPFKAAGFADLGHLAEKRGFKNTGLRALAALLLEGRISKSAQVSNWAAAELNGKQITYAATDAWISRKLYYALRELPEIKEAKSSDRASGPNSAP